MWARRATERAMDDPHSADLAPRLLTIEQVAACCQVSSKTVYRAIRRGALRASRLGMTGAYRIKPEEMQTWIEASVEVPVPDTLSPVGDAPRSGRRERRSVDGQLRISPDMGRRS